MTGRPLEANNLLLYYHFVFKCRFLSAALYMYMYLYRVEGKNQSQSSQWLIQVIQGLWPLASIAQLLASKCPLQTF